MNYKKNWWTRGAGIVGFLLLAVFSIIRLQAANNNQPMTASHGVVVASLATASGILILVGFIGGIIERRNKK